MNKSQPSKKSQKSYSLTSKKTEDRTKNLYMKKTIEKLKDEISSLNYEESLKALDLLLEDLQNEKIQVEELQKNYLLGTIYLDHCETLLKNIEQEVIELNLDDI